MRTFNHRPPYSVAISNDSAQLTQQNLYTDINFDGLIRTLRHGLSYSILQ